MWTHFGIWNVKTVSYEMQQEIHFCLLPWLCCILLGDSPASEFYIPTFGNTLFNLHRWCTLDPARWNRQCSQTSAYKIQMPGNHPKEIIQHTEHSQLECQDLFIVRINAIGEIGLQSGYLAVQEEILLLASYLWLNPESLWFYWIKASMNEGNHFDFRSSWLA